MFKVNIWFSIILISDFILVAVRKCLVLTNYHSHKYNFSLKNDYNFSELRAFFCCCNCGWKEEDPLNTFYLRLYGVGHMVNDR